MYLVSYKVVLGWSDNLPFLTYHNSALKILLPLEYTVKKNIYHNQVTMIL